MGVLRRLPVLAAIALIASGCQDSGVVEVHSLTFSGVKAVDESKLKSVLATRVSSKLPWGKKATFEKSRFDADLERIRAYYADRGYPDARVTAFDVKLNDRQNEVDITITVAEGEPFRVAAIYFTGLDLIPPAHLETLKNEIPLKVGEPRDRQLVATSLEMALNELRDHGYPYAKFEMKEDDDASSRSATLTFEADPGPISYFGPIEISGNKSVSDVVIRREVAYKPGDLYQISLMRETQRRLYRMELFQFVNVEALNAQSQPTAVPTRVTVAEGNHQRVNFGVGYGTEEKARVDAEYRHVNFLGGARSAGVHGRWSSLDRGIRADFTQPYFLAPHFSLSLEGQDWYTYAPVYTSIVAGGKAVLRHRSSASTSWGVSFISEHDSSTVTEEALSDPKLRNDLIALGLNPVTGKQEGTLTAIGGDFQRSTADNVMNARHGYQLSFHGERAGGFLPGTFNYWSGTADGRLYLPLSGRLVIANRVLVGNIRPSNDDPTQIPFSKKYFLGGATSIRGWGRFEVSPLSEGQPIGGNSMFLLGSELRTVMRGNIGGVVFLDTGNVWEQSWSIKLDDLRYATGLGIRYLTPIGPIRFDWGYQLNPIPGLLVNGEPQTRRWRIHFSIGQAF